MAEPSPAAAPGAPSGEPATGTCRHCHEPIVRRPYYLDRPRALPLVWVHLDRSVGLQTCRTRPDDWTEPDWPLAEPAPATGPGFGNGFGNGIGNGVDHRIGPGSGRELAAQRAEVPPVLALSCLLAVPAISVCASMLSAVTSMSRTAGTAVGTAVSTAVGTAVDQAVANTTRGLRRSDPRGGR